MPSKNRYQRIRDNFYNKCPKCGKLKDNRDFVTCSRCRKQPKLNKRYNSERNEIMGMFGIKRDDND